MQALPLPAAQYFEPYQKLRLPEDSKRFFGLRTSKVGRESLGGLLPSPPMSRSPPQQISHDPPQASSRRRKRSDSPLSQPPTTSSAAYPPPQGRGQTWPELSQGPFFRPPVGHFAPQLAGSYPPPPPMLGQPAFNVQGPMPVAIAHDVHFGTPSAVGHSFSRTTRKPKAHVASACVNCKKKHLRCDNARPCRRCVQAGKEESCVDVTHKKRGRPPLKAEEPQTRRAFAASPSGLPGQQSLAPPSPLALERSQYGAERSPTSLRDLRPLQSPRQENPSRPPNHLRPQPLVAYGTLGAGQGLVSPFGAPRLPGHRPFSSTSSTASSAQPPSPYFPSPGFPTSVGLSPSYESQPRSLPPASVASYSQPQGPPFIPPTPSSRSPAYQSYRPSYPQPSTAEAERATFARSRPPSGSLTAPHTMSELQLPPIRPASSSTRPSELVPQATPSAASSGQAQALPSEIGSLGAQGIESQRTGDDGAEPRDSKRARMDLGAMLGPGHE